MEAESGGNFSLVVQRGLVYGRTQVKIAIILLKAPSVTDGAAF